MNRERTWAGDIALIIGLGLILLVICNCAKAKCPGGVCPLPAAKQVVRAAERSVVSATHRLPRAACHPTCQCRETRCQPKRACGVVRRVVCRVRGR